MNGFAFGLVPLAVAFDVVFGEPPAALHPVVWMGRAIAVAERASPARGPVAQLVAGAVMAIAIPSAFAWSAHGLEQALRPLGLAGLVAAALLVKTTFSLRALGDAARADRDAVADGRIDDARHALRSLCSRDPATLDAPALLAATVESLAENASDSFVAPLAWLAFFGIPGAFFYRAVNTLDSMIGYHGRYEWLGKASARLDDAMNWVPARITAVLLLVAGRTLGLDARTGASVMRRDGGKTESPNAGRPMAAMAGLLGVRLAKAGHYLLGDEKRPIHPADVETAWRVVRLAAVLAAASAWAAVALREVRPLFSRP